MSSYVKEEYKKLQAKYDLPDYKKFNQAFEIVALEEHKSGLFANALTRVVQAKVKFFLTFLDPFIMPQVNSAYIMIVYKDVNKFRDELLDFYKELMMDFNQGYIVLMKNEKEMMQYVKKIWKKYPAVKNKFINFVEELNKIILKSEKGKENKGYLG